MTQILHKDCKHSESYDVDLGASNSRFDLDPFEILAEYDLNLLSGGLNCDLSHQQDLIELLKKSAKELRALSSQLGPAERVWRPELGEYDLVERFCSVVRERLPQLFGSAEPMRSARLELENSLDICLIYGMQDRRFLIQTAHELRRLCEVLLSRCQDFEPDEDSFEIEAGPIDLLEENNNQAITESPLKRPPETKVISETTTVLKMVNTENLDSEIEDYELALSKLIDRHSQERIPVLMEEELEEVPAIVDQLHDRGGLFVITVENGFVDVQLITIHPNPDLPKKIKITPIDLASEIVTDKELNLAEKYSSSRTHKKGAILSAIDEFNLSSGHKDSLRASTEEISECGQCVAVMPKQVSHLFLPMAALQCYEYVVVSEGEAVGVIYKKQAVLPGDNVLKCVISAVNKKADEFEISRLRLIGR